MSTTPTLDQLKRGLAISEQIATLQTELASIFSGEATVRAEAARAWVASPPVVHVDGRTRKRSAKTIAKMRASQQARWAKNKGTKVEAPAAKPQAFKAVKKRKPMSPEHRAKLVASAKARWATKKDAQ